MTFLALIAALLLVHYWQGSELLQRDSWFDALVARVSGWQLPPLAGLLLSVLLPVAGLWLLLDWVGAWLFGFIGLGISVVVLLYSFGRGDYESAIKHYQAQCREGDFQGALLWSQELFSAEAEAMENSGPEAMHRWIKKRLTYMAFERWFAVVFYFVLLGPAGALAYRLLQLYAARQNRAAEPDVTGDRVLHYVDWLPSRLMLTAFALTGDYVGSRALLSQSWQDLRNGNARVLSDCAHAALGFKATVFNESEDQEAFAQVSEWEVDQLHSLISRSAVAWLLAVSLLAIFL